MCLFVVNVVILYLKKVEYIFKKNFLLSNIVIWLGMDLILEMSYITLSCTEMLCAIQLYLMWVKFHCSFSIIDTEIFFGQLVTVLYITCRFKINLHVTNHSQKIYCNSCIYTYVLCCSQKNTKKYYF